jgi:hypothetical protein
VTTLAPSSRCIRRLRLRLLQPRQLLLRDPWGEDIFFFIFVVGFGRTTSLRFRPAAWRFDRWGA